MPHGAGLIGLLNPGGGKALTQMIALLAGTATSEGGGGFLNGFTVNAPPLMDAQNNPINVNDADTTTLIENVQITTVGDVTNDSSQYMIDSLNRIGDNQVLLDQFIAQVASRIPWQDPAAASAGIVAHDPIQERALKQMKNQNVSPDGLDEQAAEIVKQAKRKPTDRLYCSRQIHEYNYCLKPLKTQLNKSTITVVAEAGNHIEDPANPITFGQFVDEKDFRKAIELWRRLYRITRGENAKQLTALLGTDQNGLLAQLIADATTKQMFIDACTGVSFLIPD